MKEIMIFIMLFSSFILADDIKEEENDWPRIPFGATAFVSYYYPFLKSINDKWQSEGDFDNFSGKTMIAGSFRYVHDHKWQAGVEIGSVDFSISGFKKNEQFSTKVDVDLDITQVFLERKIKLSGKYYSTLKIGSGIIFADYIEDSGYRENGERKLYEWNCYSPIAILGLGLEYRYKPAFAMSIRCNYLYAKVPSGLAKKGAGIPVNMEAPEIDLSGVMLQIGPQLNF